MQYNKCLSDRCETNLFCDADIEFYRTKKTELTESGFVLYVENEIDSNIFSTYIKEGSLVQLYYTPCDSSVRMITDNNTEKFPLSDEYEKKNETILWQFETDHTLIDCGMCYIIKCADGSFVIIDSAHLYSINDDLRIYEFLRSHTPTGNKIIIAGWFLSHAHDDHVTKFMDFLKFRSDDVEIQRIYCNFPSVEYFDNGCFDESTVKILNNVNKFLDSQQYAKVVRLHSGQRIVIRNLIFTVLCTHEDVFPSFISDFNDSSSVLMLEAENTKVFLPGDASALESKILEMRYPSFLKSDILQVAHHGHFGLRSECYDLINAPLALFPTTRIKYDEEYEKIEADRHVVALAQQVYISSEGTVEIPLPFDMSRVVQLPDETNESFEGVYNLWGYEYTQQRKAELTAAFEKRKKRR